MGEPEHISAGQEGPITEEIRLQAPRRGPWSLLYEGFDPAQEGLREALCTTGNGYFATRGAAPEAAADDVHYPGTYAAGVFNRLTTEIAGEAVSNESMVNLPNWLPLTFRIDDGPWFALAEVDLLSYEQELDLRRGVLSRRLRFRDHEGRRTGLVQRRFTSMADSHLAALDTTIHAYDWSGRVEFRSALDGDVENAGVERYADLAGRHLEAPELDEVDPDTIRLRTRTNQSQVLIALAARTWTCTGGERAEEQRRLVVAEQGTIGHEIAVELERGASVSLEKVVSLYTSRDPASSEPGADAARALERAGTFRELLEAHAVHLDNAWRRLGVALEDEERTSFILNLHVFHLMQTVSGNVADLDVGVPARGLHGEAYRGHIFWDEIFVFPYLTLTMPELTRSLLRYRQRRLPEARSAAREAGYAGAMFPWQSGSDGREETQTLHLNPRSQRWLRDHSHLQRHINLAIAYNVWHYYESTGDIEFLCVHGAEMLLEIARFWASVATYDHARDRYVICGVMGPDEYHEGYPWSEQPGLDNNAYTNVMTTWVLCRALETIEVLPAERRESLWEELGLSRREVDRWEDISLRLFVPFHGEGLISQFEGYERLEEFDWDGYRERYGDIHRLDRILEAEGDTPNRYKASKQADVLMLFFLLSSDELADLLERLGYPFRPEMIPRNIDYYMHRTSHGSTLSGLVHSWVLARADRPGSWELFKQALESDVADVQGGTTPEGIHLGAMAGTVDLVARGYTGIDPRGDVLWLNPSLPRELRCLTVSIRYRHHWGINVRIADGRVRLQVPPSEAPPITVGYEGELTEVGPGETFEAPLPERA
jgi:alpha,alpha-trehalase